MGEIAEVDLTRLRAVAEHVRQAADAIAEIRWARIDPGALPDSVVARMTAPALLAGRLNQLTADMRGWAAAAETSADAFERAERDNSDRLSR